MSADDLIADVLLRGADPDEASRKMDCTLVASRLMFCQQCNTVLDEKTVIVMTVKTPSRRVVFGHCPKCWESRKSDILDAAEITQTPIKIENWYGEIFKQGDTSAVVS